MCTGRGWAWFETYGDGLLAEIKALPFKSMGPKQKQKRVEKQSAMDVADEEGIVKRKQVDAAAPVRVRPSNIVDITCDWSINS